MESLLDRYKSIFAEPKELPPHPRSHDHRIILQQGTDPVCVKPCRYPFHQKSEIEKQEEDMLERGVIHPSNSPYSSPVLLVKKGDRTWRMCVDYRELNKITVKDKFSIIVIDEILDELNGFHKIGFTFWISLGARSRRRCGENSFSISSWAL